ncbi:probable ATP-dependent RNA helicase DHX58 [Ornithorhynchus anatinus]|uniref:RNA helicase n=1 Tax=Ornithorhynchus anatinus TaxID=9258 RepID=A0A6I8NTG1_ORNAN|nr:probable ATP-dependent RNA helicase DHX58 [Ornithorhynchus anatinus]
METPEGKDPSGMELRPYQREVVRPAMAGHNVIIWMPTGSGKTRAAAYVSKHHLDTRDRGKVAVLVNKVPLVSQHSQEFSRFLNPRWTVSGLSGNSGQGPGFGFVARTHDLIICTAELLHNALGSTEEDGHVDLQDFSLLVVDECHHTHKGTVYNAILGRFLEHKLRGETPLPQILGLTASPGTGGASTLAKAKEHVLQLCANLDTWRILSPREHQLQLETWSPQPQKRYDVCQKRDKDPFGDLLKQLMDRIHEFLGESGLSRDYGTQAYEQQVTELSKQGAKEFCPHRRVCALHLRRYHDALLVHGAVRMVDALETLTDFYKMERGTKGLVLPSKSWLLALFDEHKGELARLAQDVRYENPKLKVLEEVLREQFEGSDTSTRGIIFTRTRQSAHALLHWLLAQPSLQALGIQAAVLTGAGQGSQTRPMTQKCQMTVIQQFRAGTLNLLLSTSVAEEGLDIPQCNMVVRYGLLTNEIAMVQARGRARAENSLYSFVANEGSREVRREEVNEALETLMEEAVAEVQAMPEDIYRAQILKLQREAVEQRQAQATKKEAQRNQFRPSTVRLHCINCTCPVAKGSDLRLLEGTHRVNVNPGFRLLYHASPRSVTIDRVFRDWIPGGAISCKACGQLWGMEMIYKSVKLPALSIKNFVLETPAGRFPIKQWSRVPFAVDDFDYIQHLTNQHDG